MEEEKLIKLFRSGKFTIITNERGTYTVYPSRFIEADEQPEDMESFEINDENGYMPKIVELMAEALGGSSDTI